VDDPDERGEAVVEVERWFLSRGLPHFIVSYSTSRRVLAPHVAGTLILVLELIGALNFAWPWWANVAVAVASLAALLAMWAVTNRIRHRPALARPQRVGAPECAFFVLAPAVLPLLAGGQWLTSLNIFVGNSVLLALIYLTTSYGLFPMTRWALGRLRAQITALFGLLVRALPLLLLFVVFLLFTSEVWEVAASLNGPSVAVVVGLFVVLGVLFVASRVPTEVGAMARWESTDQLVSLLAGTPARRLTAAVPDPPESPPLSRRQWGNVGLVVLVSQGLQVLFVSVMIGVFIVAFGVVAITPDTSEHWTGTRDAILQRVLWGRQIALTWELLKVALLLAAVSGFSFTLSLLTDDAYRREFLEDVLCEVREAFAVRVAYLASVVPPPGASR